MTEPTNIVPFPMPASDPVRVISFEDFIRACKCAPLPSPPDNIVPFMPRPRPPKAV